MIYLLQFRINRNIVECKFKPFARYFFIDGELIETLWNVNSSHHLPVPLLLRELIETLWNVNDSLGEFFRGTMRINRNIVECKSTLQNG